MLLTPYKFVFKQKISLNALYVVNGDSEAVNAQKHDFYCLFSRNGSCVMCNAFFGGWGVPRCHGEFNGRFSGLSSVDQTHNQPDTLLFIALGNKRYD